MLSTTTALALALGIPAMQAAAPLPVCNADQVKSWDLISRVQLRVASVDAMQDVGQYANRKKAAWMAPGEM